MGEDTTASVPLAGTDSANLTPQAGDSTTPEPQAGDGQQEHISLDEAKKLRSEAANLRKRLKAFEEADTKAKEAQLSKEQLLEKQLAEIKAQREEELQALVEERISHEIGQQAVSLGIRPGLVESIANIWEQIEIDQESGKAANVRTLLENLVKSFPELAGKGSHTPTSGGATNPSRSQTANNGEITAEYVAEVMSGKISWQSLTPERRTAILNWQTKHSYRF